MTSTEIIIENPLNFRFATGRVSAASASAAAEGPSF
jgi:hypothetical protein